MLDVRIVVVSALNDSGRRKRLAILLNSLLLKDLWQTLGIS